MAAPRKRSRAKGTAGPSTALVVFLVFFILLSLGLGVWGYFGYKKADERLKEAQKAKDTSTKDQRLRDWYKLQALEAKAAAGHSLVQIAGQIDEPNDLGALMAEFAQGKFGDDMPNKAGFQKAVGEDKKRLGWDDKTGRFKTTYTAQYLTFKKQLDDALTTNKDLQDSLAKATKREEERDKKNSDLWAKLTGEVKTVNDNALQAKEEARKDIREANEAKTAAAEDAAKRIQQLQAQYSTAAKEQAKTLKEKDEEIAKLKVQNANYEQREAAAGRAPKAADLASKDVPKGRVVRADFTGRMPYLDLGRADGVREGLTFSIFGHTTGGKLEQTPKGSLEIARVMGPHLSQGRVISMRNLSGDPVQEGDVVYNPAWNPGRKTHVAIAGIISFNGDEPGTLSEQVSDLRQFMDTLQRENVVVDAYLDLRDQKVKGEVGLKTDYLIMGAGPSYGTGQMLNLKDDKIASHQKLNEAMEGMRKEALKKGITVIPLHKFAVLTGYHIPRGVHVQESGEVSQFSRPEAAGEGKTKSKAKGESGKADEDKTKDSDDERLGDKKDAKKGRKKDDTKDDEDK